MLTRLKVSGFKNLVSVDLRLGPFTCIAGANAAGKSNLFDAIHFFSLLADRPLLEAALAVRGANRQVKNLFHRTGDAQSTEMAFEAEMIIPKHGKDDLGQMATASSTFLRYRLELGLRRPLVQGDRGGLPPSTDELEILEERLEYIKKGDAHHHLLFTHGVRSWRDSVVLNQKKGECFISTQEEGGSRIVRLHQDGGGSRGRPLSYLASTLPRTLVSSANAAESPTALLARREMQSWRLLQLEPSALRRSDDFADPSYLGDDGSHLAATLARLERSWQDQGEAQGYPGQAFAQVAGRLAEMIDDVKTISVDRDDKRELLTLEVTSRSGSTYPAPALSDGTLRFLGLAILEIDPQTEGLICLEEPENGVHPRRVPAVLEILQSIAVDTTEPVDIDNPLRQVIVNTHSPSVVKLVPEDSLILACPQEDLDSDGNRLQGVGFRPLQGTWRSRDDAGQPVASLGDLLFYLNPVPPTTDELFEDQRNRNTRVIDRQDVLPILPFPQASGK